MAFIFFSFALFTVLAFVLTALYVVFFSAKEEKESLSLEFYIRKQMFVNTVSVLYRYSRMKYSTKRTSSLQPAFN